MIKPRAADLTVHAHSLSVSRIIVIAVLTVVVALLLALTSPVASQAATADDEMHDSRIGVGSAYLPDGVTITNLPDGGRQVVVDGETFTVHVDASGSTATVLYPDGTRAELDMAGFESAPRSASLQHGMELAPNNGSTEAIASAGGFSCGFVMWVVQTIHAWGWAAAIGIILATGPAGAGVVAIIYSLGVSGFLHWVSAQCPN